MPSSESLSEAVERILGFKPRKLCPLYGHIIEEPDLLSELRDLKVGAECPIPDSEGMRAILQDIIDMLDEEEQHLLLDHLEAFVYVRSGRVEEILIEPESLMVILVNHITNSRLEVSTKLALLSKLSEHEVFLPPF
jgi:hypothetical protein